MTPSPFAMRRHTRTPVAVAAAAASRCSPPHWPRLQPRAVLASAHVPTPMAAVLRAACPLITSSVRLSSSSTRSRSASLPPSTSTTSTSPATADPSLFYSKPHPNKPQPRRVLPLRPPPLPPLPAAADAVASFLRGAWVSFTRGGSGSYGGSGDSSSVAASAAAVPWPEAVAAAARLVAPPGGGAAVINPRDLLGRDLALITDTVRRLLGSGHPVLASISGYYFHSPADSRHLRPVLVLLVAQATIGLGSLLPSTSTHSLSAAGAAAGSALQTSAALDSRTRPVAAPSILPAQRRLAEITEMIHTASLLHDDVLDDRPPPPPPRATGPSPPPSSPPSPSVPTSTSFGNKMAVLAGDFLLARASLALSLLRNPEVVELISAVIGNRVEGEFMQASPAGAPPQQQEQQQQQQQPHLSRIEYYLEKTYLRTASLIAKSCRAAAVLGGAPSDVLDAVHAYGRNLGIAFQLVEDALDFTVTADRGTAGGSSSSPPAPLPPACLFTAPALYAAEQIPRLLALMDRSFSDPGDIERGLDLVRQSNGVAQTRELAAAHCDAAVAAIAALPPSQARTALIQLAKSILTRTA
ncbi:coq1 putative hexaprenyl diphosphate synthase [Cladochytrium tenue]|nr:coq1 putative hexaprenyl diphosphate synthase [Cladochytrium tenue]